MNVPVNNLLYIGFCRFVSTAVEKVSGKLQISTGEAVRPVLEGSTSLQYVNCGVEPQSLQLRLE